MKKLLLILSCLFLTSMLQAETEKKGFLTSKACAENGLFFDCRLETTVCGAIDCFKEWNFGDTPKEELVLFVHDEGKYYNVKLDGLKRYQLDEAINRNDVSIGGEVKENTIYAKSYKAPPPPVKSFFKGCL
jgi:hypothetical protein